MSKIFLYILRFFTRGLDISFLILLPFLQTTFNISLIEIGFLSMAYTGISIVSAFFAGHINDKLGNKNVLLLAIGLYIISWSGFAFVHSSTLLWFLFVFGGISSGIVSPILDSIIMKQAEQHNRSKEIGDFAAVGDLGRIAFTMTTSLLVGFISLRITSLFFSIFAFGLFLFLVSRQFKKNVHIKDEKIISTISHLDVLKSKEYVLALLAGVFDSFSSSSLFIFLPFLLIEKGIDIKYTGLFTALFFGGYFSGRLFLGRLGDKHGKPVVLIIAQICMALLTILLVHMNAILFISLNLFLLGIVARGTTPLIKGMVADAIKIDHFEKGYSLFSSFSRTSSALSRPIYSFIGDSIGIGSIFYLSGGIALFTIIPAILFYKATTKKS